MNSESLKKILKSAALGSSFLILFAIIFLELRKILSVQVVGGPFYLFGDFSAFWSGAVLAIKGLNPYDPQVLASFQASERLPFPGPIYYAPNLFLILLPFAWLPFEISASLWGTLNLFLVPPLALMISKTFFDQALRSVLCFVSIVCFIPLLITIFFGQTTILVLSATIYSLWLYERGMDIRSGVMFSLALLKPHLIFLGLAVLLLVSLKTRRYKFVAGIALGLLAQILLVSILFPYTFGAWLQTGSPLVWHALSLPANLRFIAIKFGYLKLGDALIYVLPACSLATVLYWSTITDIRNMNYSHMYRLFGLSAIMAPYFWAADFAILLPLFMELVWRAASDIDSRRLRVAHILILTILIAGTFEHLRIRVLNYPFSWYPILLVTYCLSLSLVGVEHGKRLLKTANSSSK